MTVLSELDMGKSLTAQDLQAKEERAIRDVGEYNADLISRANTPQELVLPVMFVVQTRINNHIYSAPFDDIPTRDINFFRPLSVRGGDRIRAYFLRGKYEMMREHGLIAYVKDGENIPVPIYDGKISLPRVLVMRDLGEFERALMIDVIDDHRRIVSRDADIELIKSYGLNLVEWFSKRLDDFKGIKLSVMEID